MISKQLQELLEYLENLIEPEHVDRVIELQIQALRHKPIPHPIIRTIFPVTDFTPFPMDQIHEDVGKMMYNELLTCLQPTLSKDYSVPMIRANYGVGTLPSLFGLKSRIVGGNMPWVDHASMHGVQEIISNGVPNLDSGFGKKISLTHEYYQEALSKYPKCQAAIKIYHPDFQGPFDVAHLIFGSDIYTAFYDDEELVQDLLRVVSDTYIAMMKRVKTEIDDDFDDFCFHWFHVYGGNIVLRDDSSVNLSADMYNEHIRPHNQRIIDEFGSGSIHFCGRADQWVFDVMNINNLCGLNFGYMENVEFGQKYLDFVTPAMLSKNIPNCAYTLSQKHYAELDFKKYNTGITFNVEVSSPQQAKSLLAKMHTY